MIELTLGTIEKQSKGRNGWFHPVRAIMRRFPSSAPSPFLGLINIEIWSKRQNGEPPVDLYLTPEDAKLLSIALARLAGKHAMPGRVEAMMAGQETTA